MVPPPRDFTQADPATLTRDVMLRTVHDGKAGTGMKGFRGILSEEEIGLVVDFVRAEFMTAHAPNTRYHTAENGWPDHQRYRDAFPFASGELATDTPAEQLTAAQQRGLRLYFSSCVSCHDQGRVNDPGLPWAAQAVSYPRRHYSHRDDAPLDATSGATPYAVHDIAPQLSDLTPLERRGEELFQHNCAFCHGADGTGKNWIGTFLEPHPRDLTSPAFMATMSKRRLRQVIRDGLPGTTMPAWQSVLTEEEITALIAYVGRAFHPPAKE